MQFQSSKSCICKITTVKQVSIKATEYFKYVGFENGKFPQPIKISPGRKGWLEKDIDNWIQNLIEESNNG